MQVQQLNRVELIGRVGSIRITELSETRHARLTVATTLIEKNRDNTIVEEVTWHNIFAFTGSRVNFDDIAKGDIVHVVGRFRNQRYVNAEGEDRYLTEVVASELEKIEEEAQ